VSCGQGTSDLTSCRTKYGLIRPNGNCSLREKKWESNAERHWTALHEEKFENMSDQWKEASPFAKAAEFRRKRRYESMSQFPETSQEPVETFVHNRLLKKAMLGVAYETLPREVCMTKKSSKLRSPLMDAQGDRPSEPIMDVHTRWTSTHAMLSTAARANDRGSLDNHESRNHRLDDGSWAHFVPRTLYDCDGLRASRFPSHKIGLSSSFSSRI